MPTATCMAAITWVRYASSSGSDSQLARPQSFARVGRNHVRKTTTLSRRELLAQAGSLAALGCMATPATAAPLQPASGQPAGMTPFRIAIPRARIDRVMAQLRDVEWPDAPEGADPWA